MSGPPHWLAYAWVVSLWVAAGCVGMAGVAAAVDWVEARRGREAGCTAAGAPEPPSRASRDAEPPPTALREALSASALQTRPNRSKP